MRKPPPGIQIMSAVGEAFEVWPMESGDWVGMSEGDLEPAVYSVLVLRIAGVERAWGAQKRSTVRQSLPVNYYARRHASSSLADCMQ